MITRKTRLYCPASRPRPEPPFQLQRVSDLTGKRLAILDNGFPTWEKTLPRLADAVSIRHAPLKVTIYKIPRGQPASPALLETVAGQEDCAILGLGNAGSCTAWLWHDAITLARAGLPTVCIITRDFATLWGALGRSPKTSLPVVVIPRDPETVPLEHAMELAETALDEIVSRLTETPRVAPIAGEEAALRERFVELPDSLDVINEHMYRLGWTDGLPIIPPTEDRVQQMLAQTGGNAGDIVAELPPLRGVATLEKIAANAVMAGCLPQHMPVLLAQVRACGEPALNLTGITTSQSSSTPITILNGPIRRHLDVNCSYGLFGPGRLANATLGRALQLVLRNIGGAIPGSVCMSTMGHPGRYSFCFGENEEESPWEPLHVERGFSPETSTVTIAGVMCNIHTYVTPRDWQGMVTCLADALSYIGSNNVMHGDGKVLVLLNPQQSSRLASYGLTKDDVKQYVWEKARIPISRFPDTLRPSSVHSWLAHDGYVQVVKSPADVMLLVVGGAELNYAQVMPGHPTSVPITVSIAPAAP